MEEITEQLKKALIELRKKKQRKFDQTVDLLINLQKLDLKRTTLNSFVSIPYQIKEKKIAGFLESQNKHMDTITPEQFKKYSDKKLLKNLVNKYDFFIAQAKVMPQVATTFGRALGPSGKMPSPQLGILMNVDDKSVTEVKNKINHSIKLRLKESSLKVAIGKQSMKDEEIIENIIAVYNSVVKVLPRDKENVKNVEIKFTMTKPQKIKIR